MSDPIKRLDETMTAEHRPKGRRYQLLLGSEQVADWQRVRALARFGRCALRLIDYRPGMPDEIDVLLRLQELAREHFHQWPTSQDEWIFEDAAPVRRPGTEEAQVDD